MIKFRIWVEFYSNFKENAEFLLIIRGGIYVVQIIKNQKSLFRWFSSYFLIPTRREEVQQMALLIQSRRKWQKKQKTFKGPQVNQNVSKKKTSQKILSKGHPKEVTKRSQKWDHLQMVVFWKIVFGYYVVVWWMKKWTNHKLSSGESFENKGGWAGHTTPN